MFHDANLSSGTAENRAVCFGLNAFSLLLAHADDILFFYSNMRHSLQVNRCQHRAVYMHIIGYPCLLDPCHTV